MDFEEFKKWFNFYKSLGFKVIRCKGKHQLYNPTNDYKISKEPIDKGFTLLDYQEITIHESLSWCQCGGYLGWLLPKDVIAIDIEGSYTIRYLTLICSDLKPPIHHSPNGIHIFFKTDKDLSASSKVFTRSGAEVTYRVGGKNYLILYPAEGRQWKELNWQLPLLPDFLLPYERNDKSQVLRCIAFQIGKAYHSGLLNGFEEIDMAFVGSLIVFGIAKEEILDLLKIVFLNNFDPKRSEYVFDNTLKLIDEGKPIMSIGTMFDRLKVKGLDNIFRFFKELQIKEPIKKRNINEQSLIINLLNSFKIFNDKIGDTYILLKGECYPIDSKKVIDWIYLEHYKTLGKAPKEADIKGAIAIVSAIAGQSPAVELNNRVARVDNNFYYDLGYGKCIETTPLGWRVIQSPPIFYRFGHQESQVEPLSGGNLNELFDFINITDEKDKILLLVLLISYFIPDIAIPILYLTGGQGGGKTFSFKILKSLADPSITPILTLSEDDKELVLQLHKHRILYLDNVSGIKNSTSNLLCQAVTGTGFSKRKLYTNSDEIIYQIKRGIGLNGINISGLNPDLLDRSIIIEVERITADNRKTENEFFQEFNEIKPYILGAIFDTLSKAMAVYEKGITLENNIRLAEFGVWGSAISAVLGFGSKFLDILNRNIKRQNDEVMMTNFLMQAILQFMADKFEYEDYVGAFHNKLKELMQDVSKDPTFPKHPNKLRKELAKIRANLQEYGITYEFDNSNTSKGVIIRLRNSNPTIPSIDYLDTMKGLLGV